MLVLAGGFAVLVWLSGSPPYSFLTAGSVSATDLASCDQAWSTSSGIPTWFGAWMQYDNKEVSQAQRIRIVLCPVLTWAMLFPGQSRAG